MEVSGRILVIDDDPEIRSILKVLLTNENYEVIEAESGKNIQKILTPDFSLVILDVMMPDESGYEVCQKIRTFSNVPILFLTAKSQNSDLVLGFSCGADDYLSKPFEYSELISRVKGLIRRYEVYTGKYVPACNREYLEYSGIKIGKSQNEAYKDDVKIDLTDTEYRILKLLMSFPNHLFSAANIYEQVWKEHYMIDCRNTVMVHIRKLREKIEQNPRSPKHLITEWGKGYRFV